MVLTWDQDPRKLYPGINIGEGEFPEANILALSDCGLLGTWITPSSLIPNVK